MSMGLAHTTRPRRMMVFIVPPVIDFYKHFGERDSTRLGVEAKKSFPICYVDVGPWKSKFKVPKVPNVLEIP